MANIAFGAADSSWMLHKTGKILLLLALLCMAFFITNPITAKSTLYRVFRGASKVQLMWQTRNWDQIKGPHFIVRYQDPDVDTAHMVLNTAEKDYAPVAEKFGFTPQGKTLIVIYPTKESLGRSFGWTADESAMGVYWAGVIRVLSPKVWIDERDPAKFAAVFQQEGPMAHEFTHLMVDYATGGNYTRWFTEGVAQYQEVKVAGCQVPQRKITNPDEIYPLAEMDRDFDNLPDQNLAYFQSFQAVNYLVKTYGEESLKSVLNNLGRGETIDQSFQQALGVSLDQFEGDLKNWLVQN